MAFADAGACMAGDGLSEHGGHGISSSVHGEMGWQRGP